MRTKGNKKVKLHPKYRALVWGGQKVVPWLTISGVWLEELGFNVGDMVRITTREKLLIIEPVEAPQELYKEELREVKQTLRKLSK